MSFELLGASIGVLFIDLVLSADNAVCSPQGDVCRQAVQLGVAAAIGLRIVFVFIVFFFLLLVQLPLLQVVGGLLIYMSWQLVRGEDKETNVEAGSGPIASFLESFVGRNPGIRSEASADLSLARRDLAFKSMLSRVLSEVDSARFREALGHEWHTDDVRNVSGFSGGIRPAGNTSVSVGHRRIKAGLPFDLLQLYCTRTRIWWTK